MENLNNQLAELKTSNIKIEYMRALIADMKHCYENRSTLEIIMTACPPYSYGVNPNTEKLEFQFDGRMFDYDPGLVAKQSLEELLPFLRVCEQNHVPVCINFAYADQEGRDEDILATLNADVRENYFRYIERSMGAALFYANGLLRVHNLGHISFADVSLMSNTLITPNSMAFAKSLMEEMDLSGLNEIIDLRSDTHKALFNKNDYSFRERRTLHDIQEHIALGYQVSILRKAGRKVSIATMSINHLSKLFNQGFKASGADPKVTPQVPILRVNYKYN